MTDIPHSLWRLTRSSCLRAIEF